MLKKKIKNTILYCVFVLPFYYCSGTVISYGSNFLTSYGSGSGSGSDSGSGSTRQKVTVPTVSVSIPQRW